MDQPGVAARRSTGSCFLRPFQPSESSHIWRTGSGVTEATAAAEKVVVRPEATVPGIHYLWRTSHHDEFNLELQPGEARSWKGRCADKLGGGLAGTTRWKNIQALEIDCLSLFKSLATITFHSEHLATPSRIHLWALDTHQ